MDNALSVALMRELQALLANGNSAPDTPLLIDVLFSYRQLLGRLPEFDGVDAFRDRLAGCNLFDYVRSLLSAPEFQARIYDMPDSDLAVMAQLPDNLRLWFYLKDRTVGLQIALGRYEPEVLGALAGLLKPGMHCVDVGANIGLFTVLMAAAVGPAGGSVHAFEPFPSAFALLERNCAENQLQHSVQLHAAACHAASGSITIFSNPNPFGNMGHMFTPHHAGASITTGMVALTVPQVAVDEAVPADKRIGLVKIDIEGAEPHALRGMQRILQRDRPILLAEFNPYCLRNMNESDPAEYLAQLRSYNYRVLDLADYLRGSDQQFEYHPTAGETLTQLVCLPN